MDFDKDHVAEDDLGADEEETQDYDFYKDSQNE